jgi:hypothetical protein
LTASTTPDLAVMCDDTRRRSELQPRERWDKRLLDRLGVRAPQAITTASTVPRISTSRWP